MMAVSPEGGSSTRPKEPWGEKSASRSDTVTPAGRFFTKITVVLLSAAACTPEGTCGKLSSTGTNSYRNICNKLRGVHMKHTWLKESRLTPLSSRNCRVSWTIWVSPRAILTATLPFDSCREEPENKQDVHRSVRIMIHMYVFGEYKCRRTGWNVTHVVQDLAFCRVVFFSDGICHCTRTQKQGVPVVWAKKKQKNRWVNSKKTINREKED